MNTEGYSRQWLDENSLKAVKDVYAAHSSDPQIGMYVETMRVYPLDEAVRGMMRDEFRERFGIKLRPPTMERWKNLNYQMIMTGRHAMAITFLPAANCGLIWGGSAGLKNFSMADAAGHAALEGISRRASYMTAVLIVPFLCSVGIMTLGVLSETVRHRMQEREP
jgi:hypothetical protein